MGNPQLFDHTLWASKLEQLFDEDRKREQTIVESLEKDAEGLDEDDQYFSKLTATLEHQWDK